MTAPLQALRERIERDQAVVQAAMVHHQAPDGSALRIARFGSGPTIVCVPTVAELSFVYLPHIQHLADRYEVVLYEPRLSRSTRVTVPERAAELGTVIDVLGGAAVHLLAWSDSGAAAYLAARQRPDRFQSLALLGLADRYTFPGMLDPFARLLYRRPIERLVPAVAVAALLARYLGGPRISWRWVFGEAGRIERLPLFFKHSILPLMLEHEPMPDEVTLPSMLIGGDNDALVPVERMLRMASLLGAKCEFALVPGGEHLLGYASPAEVNLALDRFYTRLATAARMAVEVGW